MSVEFEHNGNILTAFIKGDIDHHAASEIRLMTDGELERTTPELLILDLSNVSFMDSSGIGLILGRVRTMKGWNGKVRIAAPQPFVKKMIELSGLKALIMNKK